MRKILKASAGTGKTYRLSLEYINALLDGESFTEIVVMTFTRKATAEIRERIFDHLEDLLLRGRKPGLAKPAENPVRFRGAGVLEPAVPGENLRGNAGE